MLGEKEGDASVLRAEGAAAHPHDRPGTEEGVEVARVVFRDASGKDACLQIRRRHEGAFKLRDRVKKGGLSALGRIDAVPRDRESAERILLDGLDLAAEARERPPAQCP